MGITSPGKASVVRLVGTVLLIALVAILAVQHILNRQMDWRAVNYAYGDEIHVEPHGWKEWRHRLQHDEEYLAYRDEMERLRADDTTTVVDFRPFSNGEAMRRAVVQMVAHDEGAIARYGYVLPASNPVGNVLDEIGFSNKYDEPMIVLAPPDVIEALTESAEKAHRRDAAQQWINDLPSAEGKRPVPYSASLRQKWAAVVVRVEPARATVLGSMGAGLLAVGLAIWWGRVVWQRARTHGLPIDGLRRRMLPLSQR